ncbi:hypothetical protein [Amycolatopsis vancoresmycina]|uniref:Uncharacterized protein n=1 Tax=Amycolatopsis vancoresmycina DSM 44592 TaxID=1292037 RepID=R1HH15_9PSEU|nr:hypothetical protein [Amycolatopsis vancoresmycina]EOD59701.1 hypothetical protein H480_41455 [Amycolatopsis vancoresmycina DSM 44592]
MGFWGRRKKKPDLTEWRVTALEPIEPVAHWGFAADTADSWVTGQLLLLPDGVLVRRYGGSRYGGGETTYQYGAWELVTWWPGITGRDEAIGALRGAGYDLYEPDPVPPGERTAGPFPGAPDPATPI